MPRRTLLPVSIALLATLATAQQGNCRDVGPTIKPQELTAGPSTMCGSGGLAVTVGGVSYTSSMGFCPSFIDTIPEHGLPTPTVKLEGYYIYTYLDAKPVMRDYYECNGMWWWQSCDHDRGPLEIYRVDNSIAVECGREPPPAGGSNSDGGGAE